MKPSLTFPVNVSEPPPGCSLSRLPLLIFYSIASASFPFLPAHYFAILLPCLSLLSFILRLRILGRLLLLSCVARCLPFNKSLYHVLAH